MKIWINYQYRRRPVKQDFRQINRAIGIKAGQRQLPLPFSSISRILPFTKENRNIFISFRANVPIVVDVHTLRIGELDPRTIGQMDLYPVPDAG